ncbi:MAG: EAL domain-containing protein [Rhodospirillales bacterium]|nr:EAL domain-containing protein [Rhodospirillales bacterium]
MGYSDLSARAREHATVGARHIEIQLISVARDSDAVRDIAPNILYATRGAAETVAATWITDRDGTTVGFAGRSIAWPEIVAQAPIRVMGFEGTFFAACSTGPIIIGTVNTFLAFLALGFAAWYCFRRLPLTALDTALGLLQQAQAEAHEKNVRFDTALDHMSQGLCMFDRDQKILVCNKRYAEMYGLTREQTRPGTTLREIVQYRIAKGLYSGATPNEYMHERTARVTEASNSVQQLSDGRFVAIARRPMACGGWVTTHEDITEQRQAEAKIAYMAHHDALTGLPNRTLLHERLDQAIERVGRGEALAVHCLDLDHFKDVNDTLGHAVGDALLQAVTARVAGCIRETDTLGRVSGDEFTIIQCPIASTEEVMAVAARIVEVVQEPFSLMGHQVMIGTSIGVALAPKDGVDGEMLLRNADLALYKAKQERRGTYRFFEPDMNSDLQSRRDLEVALRNAIQSGEFEVYYQPLLNLKHNEVCSFEALIRWNRPAIGMVSPAHFIPLAEETGLINQIGEWVMREACREAASWPDHIMVSVNLSSVQFKNRSLVQMIMSALAASGLAPGRLELEITESVLVQDSDSALEMLKSLRLLGVKIALDDFGTGYSSLSYLQSFPFDKIKIDRSFIKDLTSGNENALAIVSAVVQLGSSLGITTTAEGVETADQLEIVRSRGAPRSRATCSVPRSLLSRSRSSARAGQRPATQPERGQAPVFQPSPSAPGEHAGLRRFAI